MKSLRGGSTDIGVKNAVLAFATGVEALMPGQQSRRSRERS